LLAQTPLRAIAARNLLAGALCIVVVQSIIFLHMFAYRLLRFAPPEADFIARLRATEGHTVLTTHVKIAQFTDKKLLTDYNNPDCCAQDMTTRCAWFIDMLPRADIIVVNEELLKWDFPELCRLLLAVKKPIVFESDADKVEFQRRAKSESNRPTGN
jgi:hypothetical protein